MIYVLALEGINATAGDVPRLMEDWQLLNPFADVRAALEKLKKRYRLVALSNGEADFLNHLATNRIGWDFDRIVSVEEVGAFKPHPGVYRRAATSLHLEVGQCMMVSANSFDVMGARACGMRGAFVNRNALPYEETPYRPDVEVGKFYRANRGAAVKIVPRSNDQNGAPGHLVPVPAHREFGCTHRISASSGGRCQRSGSTCFWVDPRLTHALTPFLCNIVLVILLNSM